VAIPLLDTPTDDPRTSDDSSQQEDGSQDAPSDQQSESQVRPKWWRRYVRAGLTSGGLAVNVYLNGKFLLINSTYGGIQIALKGDGRVHVIHDTGHNLTAPRSTMTGRLLARDRLRRLSDGLFAIGKGAIED